MKIIGLTIENLRKIKAANLDFNGKNLVQIRGKNGAGKTTVIEALKFLFEGAKKIPSGIVKKGEFRAKIEGKTDDFVIKRTITADGKSTLTIEDKTGKKKSPQAFLDSISCRFLDPEYFIGLDGKEKRKIVIDYLGIDTTDIDNQKAETEQQRLYVGRELKNIGDPTPVEKVKMQSMQELLKQREDILTYNDEEGKKGMLIISELDKLRDEMIKILSTGRGCVFDDFENDLKKISELYKREYPAIKKLPIPDYKSTEDIEKQITDLEENNRKAQAYQDYINKKNKRDEKQKEYDNLTNKIKMLRNEKAQMMSDAKLPIAGLEIGEDCLLLNEIPDSNWSTTESLKVAIYLAVAFSGELKTVYIKRGESFDSESLAKLKAFAEKQDIQIIMEIVDSSYSYDDDGIIYLEEGEIISTKKGENK